MKKLGRGGDSEMDPSMEESRDATTVGDAAADAALGALQRAAIPFTICADGTAELLRPPPRVTAESFAPTSEWMQQHLYYSSAPAPFHASDAGIRRAAHLSATSATSGGAPGSPVGDDGEGEGTPLRVVMERYADRAHNLSAVHHSLFSKTRLVTVTTTSSSDRDGRTAPGGGGGGAVLMLPITEFLDFVHTLTAPTADISHAERWVRQVGLVVDGCVAYEDLMGALDRLFTGDGLRTTAARCFRLCDVTKCDHILKPVFQQLRGEHHHCDTVHCDSGDGSDLCCAGDGDRHDGQALGADGGSGRGLLLLQDPDITYCVVHGVMRAFDRVAKAEEEAVRAAFLKKNKKLRKKKNLVVPMPTKRQFHISPEEFEVFLATDPHLVLTFLPFVLKRAVLGPSGDDQHCTPASPT